jgi:hypothetical protein
LNDCYFVRRAICHVSRLRVEAWFLWHCDALNWLDLFSCNA